MNLQGPQGIQGPPGLSGADGVSGKDGATGLFVWDVGWHVKLILSRRSVMLGFEW